MEAVILKLNILHKALKTLEKSIELLNKYSDNLDLSLALRDSVIQRFEYCVDLFWKFLKIYLEQKEKVILTSNSPRGVIRQAALTRIISEEESQKLLEMVDSRNQTSHIYRQEIANTIAHNIPNYYYLMQNILEKLKVSI